MAVAAILQVKTSIKGRALDTLRFGEREVTIGRDPSCAIVFDNPGVSRVHAVIEVSEGGAVRITDRGSSNGTYVNGRRVETAYLRPGDQIEIGKFTLEASHLGGAAVAAAPQAAAPAFAAVPGGAVPEGGTVVLGAEQRQRILGESTGAPRASAAHAAPRARAEKRGGAGTLVAAFLSGAVFGAVLAYLLLS
jgi:pSer/pThr/pTyr-binding forkhead associated (FHA) protein